MFVLMGGWKSQGDGLEKQMFKSECKLEALEKGTIHLGSANGPAIQFDALPYPLIEI